jgi:hypothetical protein
MECRIHRLRARNKLWAEISVGRTPTPGFWVTLKTFHRVYPASDVNAAFVFIFRDHLAYNLTIFYFQSFIHFFRCRLASLIRIWIRILKNVIILYYIPLELLKKRVFVEVRIDFLILWWTANHNFFLKVTILALLAHNQHYFSVTSQHFFTEN